MNEENKNCWLLDKCNKIDCDRFCQRYFKMNFYYDEALIDLNQRHHIKLLLDQDERDRQSFERLSLIEKNIVDYVKSGNNLLIYSNQTGNGKTSWALRMVESYLDKIWAKSELKCKVLFVLVPKYLLGIKENISEPNEYIKHIKNNILDADIVIWDDIGTKAATSWEHEHLMSCISARINLGKSNIFTTNLSLDELHQALGDRLYSRVVIGSEKIKLVGLDKRGLSK